MKILEDAVNQLLIQRDKAMSLAIRADHSNIRQLANDQVGKIDALLKEILIKIELIETSNK